jgi:hypothetical protein
MMFPVFRSPQKSARKIGAKQEVARATNACAGDELKATFTVEALTGESEPSEAI